MTQRLVPRCFPCLLGVHYITRRPRLPYFTTLIALTTTHLCPWLCPFVNTTYGLVHYDLSSTAPATTLRHTTAILRRYNHVLRAANVILLSGTIFAGRFIGRFFCPPYSKRAATCGPLQRPEVFGLRHHRHLEIPLAGAAIGTAPRLGHIFPARAGCDTVMRHALRFVV